MTFLGGPDCDTSEGARPVIIADGLRDWPALRKWTPAFLAERFGDDEARSPCRGSAARAQDAAVGRDYCCASGGTAAGAHILLRAHPVRSSSSPSHTQVFANDRAPARPTDADEGSAAVLRIARSG